MPSFPHGKTLTEALVTFAYEAQQDDELTLKVGQVLKNVRVVDEGWAQGELNGKVGMFPDNFVEMKKSQKVPEERPPAPVPKEEHPPPAVAKEGLWVCPVHTLTMSCPPTTCASVDCG